MGVDDVLVRNVALTEIQADGPAPHKGAEIALVAVQLQRHAVLHQQFGDAVLLQIHDGGSHDAVRGRAVHRHQAGQAAVVGGGDRLTVSGRGVGMGHHAHLVQKGLQIGPAGRGNVPADIVLGGVLQVGGRFYCVMVLTDGLTVQPELLQRIPGGCFVLSVGDGPQHLCPVGRVIDVDDLFGPFAGGMVGDDIGAYVEGMGHIGLTVSPAQFGLVEQPGRQAVGTVHPEGKMQQFFLIAGVHQRHQRGVFKAPQPMQTGVFQAKDQIGLFILIEHSVLPDQRRQHVGVFRGQFLLFLRLRHIGPAILKLMQEPAEAGAGAKDLFMRIHAVGVFQQRNAERLVIPGGQTTHAVTEKVTGGGVLRKGLAGPPGAASCGEGAAAEPAAVGGHHVKLLPHFTVLLHHQDRVGFGHVQPVILALGNQAAEQQFRFLCLAVEAVQQHRAAAVDQQFREAVQFHIHQQIVAAIEYLFLKELPVDPLIGQSAPVLTEKTVPVPVRQVLPAGKQGVQRFFLRENRFDIAVNGAVIPVPAAVVHLVVFVGNGVPLPIKAEYPQALAVGILGGVGIGGAGGKAGAVFGLLPQQLAAGGVIRRLAHREIGPWNGLSVGVFIDLYHFITFVLLSKNHQFRHAVLPQIQGGHRPEAVFFVGAVAEHQFFQRPAVGLIPRMLFSGICRAADDQNGTQGKGKERKQLSGLFPQNRLDPVFDPHLAKAEGTQQRVMADGAGQQRPGVRLFTLGVQLPCHLLIAGQLDIPAEQEVTDPHQRMEPVDRKQSKGQTFPKGIPAPEVGLLVGDDVAFRAEGQHEGQIDPGPQNA